MTYLERARKFLDTPFPDFGTRIAMLASELASVETESKARYMEVYNEAANAFNALAKIIVCYDAYRARGVIPAPNQYQAVVDAINDARKIMGPQFQVTQGTVAPAQGSDKP